MVVLVLVVVLVLEMVGRGSRTTQRYQRRPGRLNLVFSALGRKACRAGV
jgi:hypothetical protein